MLLSVCRGLSARRLVPYTVMFASQEGTKATLPVMQSFGRHEERLTLSVMRLLHTCPALDTTLFRCNHSLSTLEPPMAALPNRSAQPIAIDTLLARHAKPVSSPASAKVAY